MPNWNPNKGINLLCVWFYFYQSLNGKTELIQARADMLIECLDDILTPLENILKVKYNGKYVSIYFALVMPPPILLNGHHWNTALSTTKWPLSLLVYEYLARKVVVQKYLPKGLANIEKMYELNNNCDGWFVGDEVNFYT